MLCCWSLSAERFVAEDLSSQALNQTIYRVEQQIGKVLKVAETQVDIYAALLQNENPPHSGWDGVHEMKRK